MPRFIFIFIVVVLYRTIYAIHCYGGEPLKPGDRYKIITPIYIYAQYEDLNDRQITREKATAYLHAKKYYKKSTVAFQCPIPVGTIMTIIDSAPKVWHIPFFANRYLVHLTPDISRGLEVIIELNRGIEGNLDGLNPKLFSRWKE